MDDLTERLAEALAVCDAATEGPWDYFTPNPKHNRDNTVYSIELDEDELALSSHIVEGATWPDAEFIAHARTGYPAALRALQAVLSYLNEMERLGDAATSLLAFDIRRAVEEAVSDE